MNKVSCSLSRAQPSPQQGQVNSTSHCRHRRLVPWTRTDHTLSATATMPGDNRSRSSTRTAALAAPDRPGTSRYRTHGLPQSRSRGRSEAGVLRGTAPSNAHHGQHPPTAQDLRAESSSRSWSPSPHAGTPHSVATCRARTVSTPATRTTSSSGKVRRPSTQRPKMVAAPGIPMRCRVRRPSPVHGSPVDGGETPGHSASRTAAGPCRHAWAVARSVPTGSARSAAPTARSVWPETHCS